MERLHVLQTFYLFLRKIFRKIVDFFLYMIVVQAILIFQKYIYIEEVFSLLVNSKGGDKYVLWIQRIW
jgi:hypothetical protein